MHPEKAPHRLEIVGACFAALCVMGMVYLAPNKYSYCDPLGCLLTSQSILRHGTVRLDDYRPMLERHERLYAGRIVEDGGHLRYYFPIGTCLYAVPFVALANLLGRDMAEIVDGRPIDDLWLQNVLSALSVGLSFLLVYAVVRAFLSTAAGALLTATCVLGGPMTSTMGTALWSCNFEVLFMLASILLLVFDAQGRRPANVYVLAFLLFSAYLCRPTAALFVGTVFIYVGVRKPLGQLLRLAAGVAFPALLLVCFSLHEYGRVLPPYYLPQRLGHTQTFWTALYGNLLSPARGLFVYSPFLLLTACGAILLFRRLRRSLCFWLALSWFGLHLLAVSRFPHWWGGHCYGPRLLADAFPAWILSTVLVWRCAATALARATRYLALGVFILLALVALAINTVQGLYNPATMHWNGSPNLDSHPEYLFDWRYPQFLATEGFLAQRMKDHARAAAREERDDAGGSGDSR